MGYRASGRPCRVRPVDCLGMSRAGPTDAPDVADVAKVCHQRPAPVSRGTEDVVPGHPRRRHRRRPLRTHQRSAVRRPLHRQLASASVVARHRRRRAAHDRLGELASSGADRLSLVASLPRPHRRDLRRGLVASGLLRHRHPPALGGNPVCGCCGVRRRRARVAERAHSYTRIIRCDCGRRCTRRVGRRALAVPDSQRLTAATARPADKLTGLRDTQGLLRATDIAEAAHPSHVRVRHPGAEIMPVPLRRPRVWGHAPTACRLGQ
jgi:hypothetical protein